MVLVAEGAWRGQEPSFRPGVPGTGRGPILPIRALPAIPNAGLPAWLGQWPLDRAGGSGRIHDRWKRPDGWRRGSRECPAGQVSEGQGCRRPMGWTRGKAWTQTFVASEETHGGSPPFFGTPGCSIRHQPGRRRSARVRESPEAPGRFRNYQGVVEEASLRSGKAASDKLLASNPGNDVRQSRADSIWLPIAARILAEPGLRRFGRSPDDEAVPDRTGGLRIRSHSVACDRRCAAFPCRPEPMLFPGTECRRLPLRTVPDVRILAGMLHGEWTVS